jgi:hypothetical protein
MDADGSNAARDLKDQNRSDDPNLTTAALCRARTRSRGDGVVKSPSAKKPKCCAKALRGLHSSERHFESSQGPQRLRLSWRLNSGGFLITEFDGARVNRACGLERWTP